VDAAGAAAAGVDPNPPNRPVAGLACAVDAVISVEGYGWTYRIDCFEVERVEKWMLLFHQLASNKKHVNQLTE
jgi:hypothetical protein